MRIVLNLSNNYEQVPFNYQRYFVGAFHKWLGENSIHDDLSLYSLSWLIGGKKNYKGLEFKHGAQWMISAHDVTLLKQLVQNIQQDPIINFGMEVRSLTICEEPNFTSNKERFHLASPVFIKRNVESKIQYYYYFDQEADELMTITLQNKLKKAGLSKEGVMVSFDKNYQNPKTKSISYNGIVCKASMCPVVVEGTPEQIAFAWNVGIGNSTGIGFGALR